MRWVVWIVASLAVLALIVAIIGALLPKAHTASRTARVALPPDALYTLLTDIDRFPDWRTDVKRVERLPDRNGLPAWIEHGRHGAIPLFSERMERPSRLVGRIGEGLAFGGTWTYRIAPAPGGSELTITEDGEIYNPGFRFLARFVFGYYSTLDGYIKDLQAKVAATP
jgi:hypothetical protein